MSLLTNCPDSQVVRAARLKARAACTIPGGGIYFHFEFCAYFLLLGEAYTNEIKHDIYPE